MRLDRIITIRDHLRDNVQDARFTLAFWAGNEVIPWMGDPGLSCGTVACAIGHATTIPEFQKAGFCLTAMRIGKGYAGVPIYGDASGFNAVANFLQINTDTAEYLFDPIYYPNGDATTRLEVVERLDQYITENQNNFKADVALQHKLNGGNNG